jgi:hypothetical protein
MRTVRQVEYVVKKESDIDESLIYVYLYPAQKNFAK